ncbi:colicin immunity protein [Cedecea colo]|uniref:Colicin immunity protein n=2 Tax=Cedecea colo TaxID=2552946 RepID=A0ABX0VMF1_9ENTR|nr:colicin immunity protein [Cedecea colo]
MEERELLTKASELSASVGEGVSKHLGAKYRALSNEIAANIKNFQGKKIRTYNDAMRSLKKVLTNPGVKINKGDKDAIVNAWKHLNAKDMANKPGYLGKSFKAADIALKVEKVREKSIIGYETGNWGPLLLEVESWVLSGLAAGLAMGILATIAPIIATTVGLPVSAIVIMGIIAISIVASFIDDKLVDRINNELVRPAY